MIIYRVKCKVENEIAERWEQFFIEKHLDDVVNTGYFQSYNFHKQIDPNEEGYTIFITDYYCQSLDQYQAYVTSAASNLKAEVIELFEGKFTATRTLQEVLATR